LRVRRFVIDQIERLDAAVRELLLSGARLDDTCVTENPGFPRPISHLVLRDCVFQAIVDGVSG
jgi:hypothetical protein